MTILEETLPPERLDWITASLRKALSKSRMLHVLGAAHMAVRLADAHRLDKNSALLAGLLHDVAKHDSQAEQRALIEQHEGGLDPELEAYPKLWHAVAGSILARTEYGVTSPAVLRAIRLHPTGEAFMSDLDKVTFLADYVEPTRTWSGSSSLREMALHNLDLATDVAIVLKNEHIITKGNGLHCAAERALEAVYLRRGEDWNPREQYDF